MADLHVVSLCTGNAARSVMAGVLLREHVPGLILTTSGTHVLI
jgi:protein-tyrosine-phosphatase